MKNADVPLWDKGDNTDDFTKGGGRARSFNMDETISEKEKEVEEIYSKVLGRKPTSREISFYKYSGVKEEEIINKLLNSSEFKENIEKVNKFPDLENTIRRAKMANLKLKSNLKDQEREYNELKFLLNEKNSEIKKLREKDSPYIANQEVLNENKYRSFVQSDVEAVSNIKTVSPVQLILKEDSLISRIIKLFSR